MPRKRKQSTQNTSTQTQAIQTVPRKYNSGRKCSVCSHPSVEKINFWISQSKSFRHIASHFGMSYRSVGRHTEKCLQLDVQVLVKEKKIERAIDYHEELQKQFQFCVELQEACREMLLCEQTDKISFFPRATDVDIIYYDLLELNFFGNPTRKTMDLQTIINRIKQIPDIKYERHIVKMSEMHEYALNTVVAIDKVLDKFAKVQGLYKKDKDNIEKPTATADSFIEDARIIAGKNKITVRAALEYAMQNEFIPREFHQEIKLKLPAFDENN